MENTKFLDSQKNRACLTLNEPYHDYNYCIQYRHSCAYYCSYLSLRQIVEDV